MKNQFEIIELEYTTLNGYGRKLNKGDKVEVSSCVITNDVGGTTIIRNKDYKSVVDGMKLNVELPDGTFEHTTIESHDKLVNLPIEIEVIDEFYDYETGFNYKGKVTNKNLVRQLAEIGITGYIPDDYKIYKDKSLYEKVLKANKNFDPSIVNFSEFDIVKKLDKDCEIEL